MNNRSKRDNNESWRPMFSIGVLNWSYCNNAKFILKTRIFRFLDSRGIYSLGIFAQEENIEKLITPINAHHYEDLTLPYTGLAAAKTLQRALSLAWIPALAMVTRPCSMTSWIAVLSISDILSNSSMQTTPLSASTIAPASKRLSPE